MADFESNLDLSRQQSLMKKAMSPNEAGTLY